jgi:hypothetical protein
MYTLVKSGSLPFQHGLNLRPPGPSQPSDPNQRTPGLQRLLLPHSTATPTSPPQLPPQRTDETHRPAINGLSTVKMIAIGVGVVGGILFIVFTYMLIRRYLYRRQPTRPQSPNSTNRDSDVNISQLPVCRLHTPSSVAMTASALLLSKVTRTFLLLPNIKFLVVLSPLTVLRFLISRRTGRLVKLNNPRSRT